MIWASCYNGFGDILKLYSIASGSSGNATYIEHENLRILVDAGVSFKKLSNAFLSEHLSILNLTHVLLTHEHVDHIRGIETLYNNINVPLYTSYGTAKAMKYLDNEKFADSVRIIEAFSPFKIGTLTITPIPLSHDAAEPLGFIFETNSVKLGYITDTGYIRETLIEPLSNCDFYYFEANHDPILLKNSNRPYPTIHRILTERGHLSNEDAAYYFSKMMGTRTKGIIMAHISEECNTIDKIKTTFESVLKANQKSLDSLKVYYASQTPLEVIEL